VCRGDSKDTLVLETAQLSNKEIRERLQALSAEMMILMKALDNN
jgi:hypothetical protein